MEDIERRLDNIRWETLMINPSGLFRIKHLETLDDELMDLRFQVYNQLELTNDPKVKQIAEELLEKIRSKRNFIRLLINDAKQRHRLFALVLLLFVFGVVCKVYW